MRVAITGGVAEGKSTVCAMLGELGFKGVSADEIVAGLYRDSAIIERVETLLGPEFVDSNQIDRERLRTALSERPDLRAKLNAIFHPAVMREILVKTDTDEVTFAEVPLLIETATQGWFDQVWVVSAGVEEQRKRLTKRLGSEHAADSLLATQLKTQAKIPFADRVIRTNAPVETVKSTIAEHVKELVEKR